MVIPGLPDISRRAFFGRAGGALAVLMLGDSPYPLRVRPGLEHPEPRAGITGEHVLSADAVGVKRSRKVLDSYELARAYPEIFDGIACACSCGGKNGAHRSLLVCFETLQPTGCVACREEAELAGRLAKDQKSLAEIRIAVDKEFG